MDSFTEIAKRAFSVADPNDWNSAERHSHCHAYDYDFMQFLQYKVYADIICFI